MKVDDNIGLHTLIKCPETMVADATVDCPWQQVNTMRRIINRPFWWLKNICVYDRHFIKCNFIISNFNVLKELQK